MRAVVEVVVVVVMTAVKSAIARRKVSILYDKRRARSNLASEAFAKRCKVALSWLQVATLR